MVERLEKVQFWYLLLFDNYFKNSVIYCMQLLVNDMDNISRDGFD